MEPDPDRLFPIQAYDYVTGFCANGRQVVMGLLCPQLVAFFFDAEGNLLGKETRDWEHPAPTMGENGPYQIGDPVFVAAIERQLAAWQRELDFSAGTIHIKTFMDEDEWVGIQLLPDHYQDLEDEEFEDEEDRAETFRQRDEWLARGDFVWWWARDYFMSRTGKVEST